MGSLLADITEDGSPVTADLPVICMLSEWWCAGFLPAGMTEGDSPATQYIIHVLLAQGSSHQAAGKNPDDDEETALAT